MQQACGDGGRVQFHFGEDLRDLQRMEDVRLAGGAELPVVVLQAIIPGLADDLGVVGGTVDADSVDQLAELAGEEVAAGFRGERGCLGCRHI